MGPPENPTNSSPNQGITPWKRRKRPIRRPRMRRCLLKGCDQRYHPRQARQRYCSARCREAARAWSRHKAQEKYRATVAGKGKRNGQSRRYRERVRNRKPSEKEAIREAARVISRNFFSIIPATGQGATRGSWSTVDRRNSGFAQGSVGTRWSVPGSESGAGRRGEPGQEELEATPSPAEGRGGHRPDHFGPEIVPTY